MQILIEIRICFAQALLAGFSLCSSEHDVLQVGTFQVEHQNLTKRERKACFVKLCFLLDCLSSKFPSTRFASLIPLLISVRSAECLASSFSFQLQLLALAFSFSFSFQLQLQLLALAFSFSFQLQLLALAFSFSFSFQLQLLAFSFSFQLQLLALAFSLQLQLLALASA